MSSGMATESPNYTAKTNSLKFENDSTATNNNSRSDTNEAYVLLSLHSAPTSPSGHHHQSTNWSKENTNPHHKINDNREKSIVARLETRGSEFLIRETRTIIGRNSSRGKVDVSIGHSNFISRRHLEIFFEPPNKFYLLCKGKNGVFIDEIFQRRGLPAFQLPQTCVFRFPSTNILLEFQSLIPSSKNQQEDIEMDSKSSLIYRPLKVNIPEIVTTASNSEFISPAPSPTGTISAANSCPASPRSNNTVRFRFGNHHFANNSHQEDFQTMVAYAMSKENNNNIVKNEPLLSTNNTNIINNQINNNIINDNNKNNNNIAANVTGITNVVFAKNDGNVVVGDNKNIQGTSKVFQISPSSFQYAQTHGTPIIASVSHNSSQGIIINNGANFIKTQNGQLLHSIATPTQITTTKNTNNHHNDSNISKSLNTSSQSPPQYSFDAGADDDGKPPYSYAQLIVQAIASAHDKQLTLSGIYSFITKNYPYYRTAEKGWQNSIRHNLSLNRYFLKVPRSQSEPGKGSFWRIDPASEGKLIEQSMKRRRQRPNTGCLMGENSNRNSSRSAPTSPSNSGFVSGLATPESLSRESSPSPSQDNIESEIISTGFSATIVTPTFLAVPPPPESKFYSSKSAPGSPGSSGDLNKGTLQNSQNNSAVIAKLPISTNIEISNNGKPQATQIAYTPNGNKMILERHAVSPLQLVVNHQEQPNNANAAATAAAAIALTDLQNNFEIPQGSRQPISTNNSTIIQPTVIVQAPSTTATTTQPVASNNQNDNLNLQRVVICQPSTTVESISKPEITTTLSSVVESSNLTSLTTTATTTTTAVVTTVNSSNISRPIDLLTSVALAAAANVKSNTDNDSPSKLAPSSSPTTTTSITPDAKPNVENSVAINQSSITASSDDQDNKSENKTETLKRNLEQSNNNNSETDETTSKKLKTDDTV